VNSEQKANNNDNILLNKLKHQSDFIENSQTQLKYVSKTITRPMKINYPCNNYNQAVEKNHEFKTDNPHQYLHFKNPKPNMKLKTSSNCF
jgi:hypothetical protein